MPDVKARETPCDESGSKARAASPAASQPGPPAGSSHELLGGGNARRAASLAPRKAGTCPWRISNPGEPIHGPGRPRRQEIGVGHEHGDPLRSRKERRVPPALGCRLDEGTAIAVRLFPDGGKELRQADQPVAVNPSRAMAASEGGQAPRCVEQKPRAAARCDPLLHQLDRPSARPALDGGHARVDANGDAPLGRHRGQHAIEAGAVQVPASSMGMENELVFVRLTVSPDGDGPWRWLMSVGKELLPDSQPHQWRANCGWQTLANTRAIVA